ncbi:molecular chaperone DnaJ [Pseudomonas sp. FW300-N1A1]|uniref:molecular chaperone DnaJ n=1 Tax=Pseudomonas sp. FW300-N1A1 TaxID=2075555 RepID=UPI000CD265DA|nr:molecular chaperone DnaJ [Pseudomonas sp. FW300-N1A1]POA19494.1 molecular chaperone DnaJ [Pseudomonas sp. FW300-N1A1]
MNNNTTQLSITPDSGTKKLSAGQRKFNGLVKKIEKQSQLLQAWETSTPLYIERWHSEFIPQLGKLHQQTLELVHVLDDLSERTKLSKTDRQTLTQGICAQAFSLIDSDSCNDEEEAILKALYNKHSGRDFDADEREEDELFMQGLQEMFGVELDDDIDMKSADDIAQKIYERQQTEQTAQQQKPGKKTARQLREEAEAAQASQSVREVYRKLASALHPDRETDPDERERKTVLMQRANHAYSERNLLELLHLQLEIEHIDADTLGTLSADRLKHYNQILTEQFNELRQEVIAQERIFKQQFNLDPFDEVTPQNLSGKYQYQLKMLLIDTEELSILCEELKDPKTLKAWLKAQREYQKAMNFDDDLFDDLPDIFFR